MVTDSDAHLRQLQTGAFASVWQDRARLRRRCDQRRREIILNQAADRRFDCRPPRREVVPPRG
jgi:hypothetical protein